MTFRTFLASLFVALSTTSALSHEFWIDPVAFFVPSGEPVVADIRIGQEYEGSAYAWIPRNFRLFEIAQGDKRTPVEGRMGDRPALNQIAGDGLAVALHVTTDSRLAWSEFQKFEDFVRHKDADWALADHADRGLPDAGFAEAYSRYAKSLISVGDGAGADREYGLLTEIVALANPYTDDISGGFPVRLLYRGEPRADAQIEVFAKDAEGQVTITTVRTDAGGSAVIPVTPGSRYMLDAVVLREPSETLSAERNVVWESLWANLTFAVPR